MHNLVDLHEVLILALIGRARLLYCPSAWQVGDEISPSVWTSSSKKRYHYHVGIVSMGPLAMVSAVPEAVSQRQ